MEPVFQAIIIVVIAAAAAATVYKTAPGMSLLLSIAAALLALFLCIGLLEPLAAFFRDAIALSGLSGVYTGPLQAQKTLKKFFLRKSHDSLSMQSLKSLK